MLTHEQIVDMALSSDKRTAVLGCQLIFEDENIPDMFKIFIYLFHFTYAWPLADCVSDSIKKQAINYFVGMDGFARNASERFNTVYRNIYKGDDDTSLPLYFKKEYEKRTGETL